MQIVMPKIGFSLSEGTLSDWFDADCAPVTKGQPPYSLESDKSVQEIEAPREGTLRILAAIGEVYPVGAVLGEIV